MNLSEDAEEILESLWIHKEMSDESELTSNMIDFNPEDDAAKELLKFHLIIVSGGQEPSRHRTRARHRGGRTHVHKQGRQYVSLTPKGEAEAMKVVRRHRLAERLLVDVLNTKAAQVEETACKFEHLIRKGIEENICSLLGHPEVCPHGRGIPKGKCCLKGLDKAKKIVGPISQLKPEQEGRIAYISTKGRKKLQKLIAMGVIPGVTIRVIQRFPSYVFQFGQTQIAVDEEIANEIFVLQTNS